MDYKEPDDFEHNLIVTGFKAQELLENEVFQATVQELTAQIMAGILETNFDETEKRDNLYFLYKALQNIIKILTSSAALKPIIQEAQNAQDESSEIPDTYED